MIDISKIFITMQPRLVPLLRHHFLVHRKNRNHKEADCDQTCGCFLNKQNLEGKIAKKNMLSIKTTTEADRSPCMQPNRRQR